MSLIDISGSAKEIADFNQTIKDLQEKEDRFKYPEYPIGDKNPDKLGKLLGFGWKNVYFPITNLSTEISHTLAQHKYPNRDGARVEETGRNPLIIRATAVFINTIKPGPQEGWIEGTLYPKVYKEFLLSAFEGSTGILIHPFLGNIYCKLQAATPTIDAHFRGGEIVTCSWIETIVDDNIDNTLESLNSAFNDAQSAASEIDNSFNALSPDPKTIGLKPEKTSLLSALNSIKSAIDSVTYLSQTVLHSFDNLIYRCNNIIAACNRFNDVVISQLKQNSITLKSAVQDMKKQSQASFNKSVKGYKFDQPIAWSQAASILNNNVDDLIKLNPYLAKFSIIPAQTNILYYK